MLKAYINYPNPHVTIHANAECSRIQQQHKQEQTGSTAAGSPIFKAVQKKRYQALYRALKKSLTAPESAVAMDSERSHIEQSVGTP